MRFGVGVLILTLLVTLAWEHPGFPAPAMTPKTGGTLTIATNRSATNLYPSRSTALPDIAINFLLYDGLIITDDQGKLQPLLAKSWSSSPDGKVWTFELRDDVTFHSGRRLTAKDVKSHFDQWRTVAPTRGKVATLDNVEIAGDHRLRITLTTPNLVFLNMISQTEWSYGGIPDSEAVRQHGRDYGITPGSVAGTGPFVLKEWIRDDRVVLERYPHYRWGPPMYKNRGPAYVDRIIIRTIPEAASRAAELEVGSVDMDLALDPYEAQRLRNVRGIRVATAPKITAHHFGFNLDKELFKDRRVRRAVAHTVFQEAIIRGVYQGYAEKAIGLFHQRVEGHTPKSEIAKIHPQYDIAQAKQLLEEAGWKEGPGGIRQKDGKPLSFTVLVYTDLHEKLALVVQASARQAGIDLKVRRLEFAAWRHAIMNGEHEMYYVDGTHSTADIAYWWTTDSIPYPNHPRVRDIDDLFKVTQTTTNRAARVRAFNEIEKKLVGEAYLIPMPHTPWLFAYREHVKFAYWDPIHGIQKALDLWLDR
jgi:peptide/nickel transport system substrate-binding protein